MTLGDDPIELMQGCLFTASYDGQLRVWKDLENQAMVAVSRDLTRQGCNAIPNYSLEVITKDVSVKHSGTDQTRKEKQIFIFVAGSGYQVLIYRLPDSSYYQPQEAKKFNLLPSCPISMTQLGQSTQGRSTNTADIKLSSKYLFAATDNGHIIMAPTMDLLRNDDSTSHYNENQFIGVHRQMAKIPEFTKNETRTFSEAALGCTSISLWSEYALFISDNKGRIHVWVPDYENSRNSEENSAQKSDGIRLEPVQTVYNGNPKYIPYRPMQNIAVDPYGEYLAATDWDGMNYIFKIIQEDYRFKLEEISIENPRPIEKRESYEKEYGLKCSWSQNGKSLAISHSSGNVFIYERIDSSVTFKTVICAGDISEWVWSLSWDVNGKMLFTGNAAGLIQCWNQHEKKDQNGQIISTEWKEVVHQTIKLTDHMKTARQTHDRSGPPSPVISTLHYRLIPQSIFDRIRDLKDSEDKRDKRNYDFENYRRR